MAHCLMGYYPYEGNKPNPPGLKYIIKNGSIKKNIQIKTRIFK